MKETPYFRVDDRVELVRHARDAGRDNLPPTSATEPNDVEAAIEREYRNRHRDAVAAARGDLRSAAEQFAALEDQLSQPRDAHRIPTNATAAVEQELAGDRTIELTRQAHQLRDRDTKRWQRNNGVYREGQYPESKPLHLGLVAIVVLVESLCNTGFFAAASSLGPLGGLLLAAGVSLTNVVFGVVAGYYVFRFLRVSNTRQRLAAQCGAVAYVVVAITFNAAIAHLRDEMVAGRGFSRLDLGAAFRHPFELSALSLGLLILGLIASALAVADGFTLDDVPGYGPLHRARATAAESAAASELALRQKVLAHADAVPTRCAELLSRARNLVEEMRKIVVEVERRLERYESEREKALHWAHVLLRRYRAENEGVRSTPSPAYFAEYPVFDSEVDHSILDQLRERLDRARSLVDLLADEAHGIELEQPQRMAATRERLEGFIEQAIRQVDAGRREGSRTSEQDAWVSDARRVS